MRIRCFSVTQVLFIIGSLILAGVRSEPDARRESHGFNPHPHLGETADLRTALTQGARLRLCYASVSVLEAHDVVFPQIRSRLNLDQFKGNLARVHQPVRYPDWNVGRLVFCQHDFLVAVGDERGAFHHDPVFCAMVMHLQTNLGRRVDDNSLHLEAHTMVDAFIGTPRAHNAPMCDGD